MEEDGGCLASFIDRGSVESHRYFLARRTVLEMLRDRGYAVSDVEIGQSVSQFRSVHGQEPDLERIRISASLLSDPSQKVAVSCFSLDVRFSEMHVLSERGYSF